MSAFAKNRILSAALRNGPEELPLERRRVEETQGKRIGLTITGLAAGAFVGNGGLFVAQIRIASVVNGH